VISRRLVRIAIQVAAVIIVGYFLARAVIASWDVLEAALSDPPWLLLVLAVASAILAMVWIAVVWVWLLGALGSPLRMHVGIAAYFVGESTKYLPGALWPVVGRGEIAVRFGAERINAYTSVLYSLLLNFVLAGMLASLLTAPFALSGTGWSVAIWLLALFPIGVLMLHPRVINPVIDFIHRRTGLVKDLKPLPWGASLRYMVLYLPAWGAIGITSLLGVRVIGADPPVATLLFATYLAWVAGFLAVFAPTGLGVREAIFVAILGSSIGAGPAAGIAVLSRVAFVFADAVGAVLGLGVIGTAARRNPVPAAVDAPSQRGADDRA